MLLNKHGDRFVWLLEMCAMLHYLSLFLFGNIVAIPAFIFLLFTPFFFLSLLYACWMYYDYVTPFRAGRRWEFLRRLSLWKYLVSYFPAKLVKTADLNPNNNYVFCYHPHGILSVSGFINFVTEANGFSKFFPGITLHVLTLGINFRLPFFRDYVMALGLGAVRQDSINYKLTKCGPGHSVMIVTGGASEAEMSDPDNPYRLKIRSRTGFVREALKAGAHLVPIFSFGESEIFRQIKPTPGSFYDRFRKTIHRLVRFIPVIFYGEYGVFPLRKPLTSVVGKPIELPLIESPTAEDIAFWHEKYIEGLKNLFEENKELYGHPDKNLELY